MDKIVLISSCNKILVITLHKKSIFNERQTDELIAFRVLKNEEEKIKKESILCLLDFNLI